MRILPALISFATCVSLGACAAGTRAPVRAAPSILTRAEWGANPAVLPMTPHTPVRLTIHHTATRLDHSRSLEQKLRALQEFSQHADRLANGRDKPAWPDIPYHYYIDVSGRIGEARDIRYKGDTNTSYDPTGHALVVLEGNFEEEQPTPEQLASLRALTRWLLTQWRIPADRIASHKDFAATACPGENLYRELPALRAAVAR